MNGFRLRAPLCVGNRPFPRFCRVGRLLVCNSSSEEPSVVLKPSKPRGPIVPVSGYQGTPAAAEIKTLDVTEPVEDSEGASGSAVVGNGNGTTDSAGRENGNDAESGSSEENEVLEYDYATLTRTAETPEAAQASASQSLGGLQRPPRRERDISTDGLPEKGSLGNGGKSGDEGGRTLSLIEDLSNESDESFPGEEEEGGKSSLVQELNDMFDKTALHKGDELPFKGRENMKFKREEYDEGPPEAPQGKETASIPKPAKVERPTPAVAPRPLSVGRPRPAPPARPQSGGLSTPPSEMAPKPQEQSRSVRPPSLASSPKPNRPQAGLKATLPSSPSPKPEVQVPPEAEKATSLDPSVQSATSPQVPSSLTQEDSETKKESPPSPEASAVPEVAKQDKESPPPKKLSVAPPPKPRGSPASLQGFTPRIGHPAAAVVDKGSFPKPAPVGKKASGPEPGRVSGPRPGPVAKGSTVMPATPPKQAKPVEAVSPNLAKGPVQAAAPNMPGVLERLRQKRAAQGKRPRVDDGQARRPGRIGSGTPPQPPGAGGGGYDRPRLTPAGAGKQKRRGAREGQFGGTSAENRRKARQQRQERRQARAQETQEREEIIEVGPEGMLVSELAGKLLETPADIIKTLFMKGIMVTMTQTLDMDTVKVIGLEYGVEVLEKGQVAIGDMAKKNVEFIDEDDIENLVLRPPVVTVMGHVDHGKTSLLDYIRSSSVADAEAGGITQAIGAYQCEIDVDDEEKTICFLDTPGHEAFSAMRARGAKVTDVAVIIVAADDGLQPQTREAVSHAKAADVPIIVAINKIDIQGANPERVKQQLGELELIPEEWGGKTPVIPISAKTGEGIDALLEVIVLMAEVELELMANPDRSARGTVVEADLDKRAGPIATMLVQNGTLKVGDIVVSGASVGKVRSLTSDRGSGSTEAGPSTAVRMLGLDCVPVAGDEFQVCETETEAREIAEKAAERIRQAYLAEVSGGGSMVTLSSLASMDDEVEGIQRLNIVLRADTSGAVEAVKSALGQLPQDSVMLRYLHSATGDITESDITLASPADGVIMGFNVEPSEAILTSAKQKGVELRTYQVIYDLIDDIRSAMEGRIKSVDEKVPIGSAEVRAVFGTGSRAVAGCMVTDGRLEKGAVIEVRRKKKKPVFEGKLTSLRRVKDVVNTVEMGLECGVGCDFMDWQEGDVIEAFTLVKKSLTLEEAHAPTAITLEELELELAESNEEK
ncbi:hypothetical protein BSKO_02038 [Bryopsis sp. KO-2023]|nr:hypothetical protein BSKO_02038 [Bryopsis sp. KO-2023]